MNRTEPLILSFTEIRAENLPLVGGKGANLGELTHAGFPVPTGFCLTTQAFQQFIAACPDSDELYALLDTVTTDNLETVRLVGQRVRQTLLGVPVPGEIISTVKNAWQALGVEHAYAVRSSATAEDLPDASFAGQQDTYLNIIGETALVDAIHRCWISLFTDRAILYRCQHHFPHREVNLSVVVQTMIFPQTSGVLFTADPLTGHRHRLTIDASFGLGEALVSGLVTPDSYKVNKRTLAILERQITKKLIAITPNKNGGTYQEEIQPDQSKKTALTDEQILALTELGCQVESYYGIPQDIEWAVADKKIYLLQARPITSLYPINGLNSSDNSLHIFFSLGHQQSMTRAMSPLSVSSIQVLIPIGHKESIFENTIIRNSGGRMFVDLTVLLRHPLLRKITLGMLSQLDALAPEAVQQTIQQPAFHRPHGIRFSFSQFKFMIRILSQVINTLFKKDLTGFTDQTNSLINQFTTDISRRLEEKPSGKKRLQTILHIMPEIPPFFINWVPEAAAGIIAAKLLTKIAKKRLSANEVELLTLGISGNVVNEMNLAIGDLADLARRSPQLVESFQHLGNNAHRWLLQAKDLEGSGPFLTAWQKFLSRYGARASSEIDIYMPRWYEDPLPVLRVIVEFLKREAGHHRSHQQALIQGRQAAMQKLLNKAGHGPLGWLQKRIIKRLYYVMTEVGGMREHHKFTVILILAQIKEVLKDVAFQLVNEKKLEQPDDLWFLTWHDLFSIWDDENPDWKKRIQQRRIDLKRYQKFSPPLIVTSDGEIPAVHYKIGDAPEGALLGNPVAPGLVEGTVHVIRDPQRETLALGEILVAEFTDPGWTPLFINAGGVILEVGGALTHGAVVAREYGIPAIVGVREATTKLQTGQRVRLDGHRGIIEII